MTPPPLWLIALVERGSLALDSREFARHAEVAELFAEFVDEHADLVDEVLDERARHRRRSHYEAARRRIGALRRRPPPREDARCDVCGTPIKQRSAGTPRLRCSGPCSSRATYREQVAAAEAARADATRQAEWGAMQARLQEIERQRQEAEARRARAVALVRARAFPDRLYWYVKHT